MSDFRNFIDDLPSVEEADFEEYANLMQMYVVAAKKSNSFEGTKRLLTELYPDNAHFIYELLQNSEDACARNVRFYLKSDCLIMSHDGSKIFTLNDVKGITNIGNSTKKNDSTSVGKFGVGFKSVFSFTDAPRVYSQDYNFEIVDMLMPRRIENLNERKADDTVFVFPFKGEQNEQKKYYEQISDELKSLSDSTIMFLNNIHQISYDIDDSESGTITKEKVEDYIYRIVSSSKSTDNYWMIFGKGVDELKAEKNKLRVNVAYFLNNYGDRYEVSSVKGSVNIFFPAVKEHSNLRFIINGPFASTVARDSVRDCEENDLLFEKIFELMVESIDVIKEKGLLDISVYNMLPNNTDELEGRYALLRDKLIEEFDQHKWLLGANGDYYSVSELVRTTPNIQGLFDFKLLKEALGLDQKDWLCMAPLRKKNCINLFDSLPFFKVSYKSLTGLFISEKRYMIESYIKKSTPDWLNNFYMFLIDYCNSFQEPRMTLHLDEVISNLRETKILLSNKGDYIEPKNIYLPGDSILETINYLNSDFERKDNLQVLWHLLKIQPFNDAASAKLLIKAIKAYKEVSSEYLKSIFQLVGTLQESDFSWAKDEKIWFTSTERQKVSINELYLDEPYEQTGYEAIACSLQGIYGLSDDYYDFFSKNNKLEEFCDFVKRLGINYELSIIKADVKKNPLYQTALYNYSDNVTSHSTSEDYTIAGLEEIVMSPSEYTSKTIWNFMIGLKSLPRYCKATFSPNRTSPSRKCDSTLILLLRDNEWIPSNEDGSFYKPADISKEQLPEGFIWEDNSLFLKLVLFGTNKNRIKIQSEKLISEWGVSEDSEQAKALRALLTNPQVAAGILKMVNEEEKKYDLSEALSAQNKSQMDEVDDEALISGSVKNVTRRKGKIIEELEEGVKRPKGLKKLAIISRQKAEPSEREFLYSQYHGRCQICDSTITKWNGQKYFEGINLLNTSTLDDKLKRTLTTGWNSICFCPNHAAEYKFCSIDLSTLAKQIEVIEIEEGDDELIGLEIEMQGLKQTIKYTPKHFLALKTAFEYFLDKEDK